VLRDRFGAKSHRNDLNEGDNMTLGKAYRRPKIPGNSLVVPNLNSNIGNLLITALIAKAGCSPTIAIEGVTWKEAHESSQFKTVSPLSSTSLGQHTLK
jgi:hypothetical protein